MTKRYWKTSNGIQTINELFLVQAKPASELYEWLRQYMDLFHLQLWELDDPSLKPFKLSVKSTALLRPVKTHFYPPHSPSDHCEESR